VTITRRAREERDARLRATIPDVSSVTATALVALAPAASIFRRGRVFHLAGPDTAPAINWRKTEIGASKTVLALPSGFSASTDLLWRSEDQRRSLCGSTRSRTAMMRAS